MKTGNKVKITEVKDLSERKAKRGTEYFQLRNVLGRVIESKGYWRRRKKREMKCASCVIVAHSRMKREEKKRPYAQS